MADLSQVPWNEFPRSAEPRDKVSKNFVFSELTRSETADRHDIDNGFRTDKQVQCAVYLVREVIQPVRTHFKKAFTPNSVFHSQALERALKNKPASWSSRSQHTRGQACDIEVPGCSTLQLAEWIAANLTFDQVICECFNPAKGPNSGWVHVSIVPPGMGQNRGKKLSYIRSAAQNKYVYVEGLTATV